VVDARRAFLRNRGFAIQLASTGPELSRLTRAQAEPIRPQDPRSYLIDLRRRIAALKRKAGVPPPIYINIVRADPTRAAALVRRKSADERLEAIGYDAPPRWAFISHFIWHYRRQSAEREVASAYAAFNSADEAVGRVAVAAIGEHVAATTQAAEEAERLEAVAIALEESGSRVHAAVKCRCDWSVIAIAATRDNADRHAVDAVVKKTTESKTCIKRTTEQIPEATTGTDDPNSTFKPPWG